VSRLNQHATIHLPQAGDPAPEVAVQTLNGDPVNLSILWEGADRGLALVFLRHYGCPFCREHAREIDSQRGTLRGAGLSVALIGCGSSDEARAFREELGLNTPVFNNPGRSAYAAYGLGSAHPSSLLHPRVIAGGLRAVTRGFLPRRAKGDPLQLQGQFLISRNGIIIAAFRPSIMSDIPPTSDLLAASMSLPWP